jgi:aromatic ring hydroxylase
MSVYPGFPLGEGADAYALAFSIPMTTPGMKILCRDSFAQPAHPYDHPLSGRFDEQDAFVIFDDVEVPKDRVFIDANVAAYNAVMRTSWSANIMQQTMIRAQTKLEFAWGLANRMLKCINGKQPAAQEMLGEIWAFSEFARAAIYAAEMQATEHPGGVWFPDVRPLHALRASLPYWFPRVNEIIRLIGSHNVFATPTQAQMHDPELKPLIDRYLRGAGDMSAEERVRVFRLGWDFVGSGLASRNEQYERFYLASGQRNRQIHEMFCDPKRANRLVDQFLNLETETSI